MVVVVSVTGLVAVGVWRYSKLKIRRIARAYTFLTILGRNGSTVDSSNRIAATIDMFAAKQLKEPVAVHVDNVFKGSPQALLSEAKTKGFRG
ncbi:MAG: hypothetical protein HXX11_03500 [Desulfuromonadales bacterium]|nr:hypothetical protein [Desulfuromonadales bacterium]